MQCKLYLYLKPTNLFTILLSSECFKRFSEVNQSDGICRCVHGNTATTSPIKKVTGNIHGTRKCAEYQWDRFEFVHVSGAPVPCPCGGAQGGAHCRTLPQCGASGESANRGECGHGCPGDMCGSNTVRTCPCASKFSQPLPCWTWLAHLPREGQSLWAHLDEIF